MCVSFFTAKYVLVKEKGQEKKSTPPVAEQTTHIQIQEFTEKIESASAEDILEEKSFFKWKSRLKMLLERWKRMTPFKRLERQDESSSVHSNDFFLHFLLKKNNKKNMLPFY